jgi:hypothetical protein
MSTAALAAEEVDNGGFNGRLNDWGFSSPLTLLASRVADVGVVDYGDFFGATGAIWQVLSLDVGRYTFSFDATSTGGNNSSLIASIVSSRFGQAILKSFQGSEISGAKSYEFNVTQAGTYSLVFQGTSAQLASFITVDNVSITPVVAVPGPEAGAGIAGLAMAGIYAFVARRRKAQAAA